MKCPKCGSENTKIVEMIDAEEGMGVADLHEQGLGICLEEDCEVEFNFINLYGIEIETYLL